MNAVQKPLPRIDIDSAPFWQAAKESRLVGQCCANCGEWRWPPREHCPSCHAAAPEWRDLPDTGTIVGLVVTHRPMDPAFVDDIPLALVQVALDGTDSKGVLQSTLQRGDWEHAQVGSRVAIRFTDVRDGIVIPTFAVQSTDALQNQSEE